MARSEKLIFRRQLPSSIAFLFLTQLAGKWTVRQEAVKITAREREGGGKGGGEGKGGSGEIDRGVKKRERKEEVEDETEKQKEIKVEKEDERGRREREREVRKKGGRECMSHVHGSLSDRV